MSIQEDIPSRARTVALWGVVAVLIAIYVPTFGWLGHHWSFGVWYHTHGWAVPPIAAWLIWRGLKSSRDLPPGSSALGFWFLVPAVVLQMSETLLHSQILSGVSLLLVFPGLSLLFLGRARTKSIWFGLAFLAFGLPIPLFLVREFNLLLRTIAAVGSEWTLSAIGYDVVRESLTLKIGSVSLLVADTCSGFATLMALTMAGTLMVHLTKGSTWRKVIVIALVLPIASIANILRCVALSMLTVTYGTDILYTSAHEVSGIVAFILALLGLQAIIQTLFDSAPPAQGATA
ncbi:MAG: exosortase/archaeosortase family protein [Planctomycetota bacterium]|jgi:exosortase